ncbi:hypothetical protein B0H13DRAFT_1850250 [Mycena leptocephala]|nr:hypothetical protein B0H13DRAFT_1850250 [Mycena leptocephala]
MPLDEPASESVWSPSCTASLSGWCASAWSASGSCTSCIGTSFMIIGDSTVGATEAAALGTDEERRVVLQPKSGGSLESCLEEAADIHPTATWDQEHVPAKRGKPQVKNWQKSLKKVKKNGPTVNTQARRFRKKGEKKENERGQDFGL